LGLNISAAFTRTKHKKKME